VHVLPPGAGAGANRADPLNGEPMTRAELRTAIREACPSATYSEVLAIEGLISRQANAIARTPRGQMDRERRAQAS
jgi:hypothetical protein